MVFTSAMASLILSISLPTLFGFLSATSASPLLEGMVRTTRTIEATGSILRGEHCGDQLASGAGEVIG